MKKFYFLIIVLTVLSVSFSSCKKDSGDASSLSQKLIGKWRQVSLRKVSYTDGVQNNVTDDTDFDSSAYIQFNNNGTVVYGSNEVYGHNGNEGDTFHYTIENNLLKITDDKGVMMGLSAQIILTGTKLTLQNSLTIPDTDKGDLTLESNYNFVKAN